MEDFTYRYKTIRANFKYDDCDAPIDIFDGYIVGWQDGEFGLSRFSVPKNVTAIYKQRAANINNTLENYQKDNQYGYYWPHNDEYYKKKYFTFF
jgi:hypothetical protein